MGVTQDAGAGTLQAARGLYFVRTDIWYVERAGWLVSGIFVLGATVAAWFLGREVILVILVCSLSSIMTSLSGFCPVGNLLYRAGIPPLLNGNSGKWYLMQTDSWYLERRIYLMVGVNLTVGSLLVYLHSPYWLFYTGFVGLACVFFALTGFCIMAHFLYRSGKEPRLARNAYQ